ncbi:MAG TPA: hypothetical protein ENN69_01380 [Spirochaetia bacterium]|nr:hypothetical protein [Spirochaetia bacterium]
MERNQRHIIIGYAVFTLFFLSCLFVFILFRIDMFSFENKKKVETSLRELSYDMKTQFGIDGSFGSDPMSAIFRDTLNLEPRLLVIVVESKDHGILKAIGKSKEYLANAQFGDYSRDVSYNKPTGTAEVNLPVSLHYSEQNLTVRLSALYISFSSRDSTALIWEILYIFLGFFGLTLLMILITSLVSRKRGTDSGGGAVSGSSRRAPSGDSSNEKARRPYHNGSDDFYNESEPTGKSEPVSGEIEFFEDNFDINEASVQGEYDLDARQQPINEKPVPPGRLYSESTGLVRNQFFLERFESEIERSVSFHQDVSLLLIGLEITGRHATAVLRESSPIIHRRFPLHDLSFEYEQDRIAVIIPDEDIDAALVQAKAVYKDLETAGLKARIGIASRNNRMLRAGPLLSEAKGALQYAVKNPSNPIVAFRADPKKFQDNLFL